MDGWTERKTNTTAGQKELPVAGWTGGQKDRRIDKHRKKQKETDRLSYEENSPRHQGPLTRDALDNHSAVQTIHIDQD